MKVGDPVLVLKNNWYDRTKKSGKIAKIIEHKDYNGSYEKCYRIDFYDDKGLCIGCCNIFSDEIIELDVQKIRDCKLKELGI